MNCELTRFGKDYRNITELRANLFFSPLGLARHDSATEPRDTETEYETHSLTLVCILIRIYEEMAMTENSLGVVREIAWICVTRSTLEYRAALGAGHFTPTVRARACLSVDMRSD